MIRSELLLLYCKSIKTSFVTLNIGDKIKFEVSPSKEWTEHLGLNNIEIEAVVQSKPILEVEDITDLNTGISVYKVEYASMTAQISARFYFSSVPKMVNSVAKLSFLYQTDRWSLTLNYFGYNLLLSIISEDQIIRNHEKEM